MHKVKKVKVRTAPAKPATAQATPKPVVRSVTWPKPEAGKRVVLHLMNGGAKLPPQFAPAQWQEIKASTTAPDAQIPVDFRSLSALPDDSCDTIWNAGALGYLEAHEVVPALQHCYRILRQGGTLLLMLNDLQRVGQILAQGKVERELYRSPAGSITALDLIYGHRASIQSGRKDLQVKTGFTASSIVQKLTPCGFGHVEVKRSTEGWMMQVLANKVRANPPEKPLVRIMEEDVNDMMRKRDDINKAPEMLKITPEDGI